MADASIIKPEYTVYAVSLGTWYNITPAVEHISISDQKQQLAKCVTIQLRQVMVKNSAVGDSLLSYIIGVCDRVFLYANDGKKWGEVFRGFVWEEGHRYSLDDNTYQIKCYDNLIYLQNSSHSAFFPSGKNTQDVVASLCSEWGIKWEYTYESMVHGNLVLRGNLADIFTADLLDLVKDRCGKKYVILSDEDVMKIKHIGDNKDVHHFYAGQDAVQMSSLITMDGVRTKVVILGKADDNDHQPIEAVVSGDTAKYGTLQETISRDEETSIEDAKTEAQNIIKRDGEPKETWELSAIDIPWLRKGDLLYFTGGAMGGYYIIAGIERTISNQRREMILDLEKD